MKPIDEINVKPVNDESLIWVVQDAENNDYKKEVKLNVDESCEALLLLSNGQGDVYQSGTTVIPWRKHKKLGREIKKVLGVVRHSSFYMKFALNNGIPFDDKEAGLTPKVNVTCDCLCEIKNSYDLYVDHRSPERLTIEDVRNKLFSRCQTSLSTNLAKALAEYDYTSIAQANGKISESIFKEIQPILIGGGIQLKSCNVTNIYFVPSDGFEDYNEERKSVIEDRRNKKEEKARKEEERDFILAAQKQAIKPQAQTEIKCARCGKVSPASTRFCPVCGKELR